MKMEMLFRQSRKEPVKMPLYARSVGHHIVDPGWQDKVKKKNYLLLFWVIHGSGIFYLNNHPCPVRANEVFFYLPGDVNRIVAGGNTPWNYRYVTMDGPGINSIISQFELHNGPFAAGPCPQYIFENIHSALRTGDIHGTYAASSAAYTLLTMSLSGIHKKATLFERFKLLVERNAHEREFNIEYAANALNVHSSTLIRIVRQASGMTPGNYLNKFRLRQSHQLLCSSVLSVKEIARRSGFTDQNYFSQVFKKEFGIPPSEAARNQAADKPLN